MLFRPAAVILLFSKREDEAQELMTRLQGMYQRLPFWMQCRRVEKATLTEFRLSNGSVALSFPTTGGRSYTGTFVLADEADFMPDLGTFLNAVKANGGCGRATGAHFHQRQVPAQFDIQAPFSGGLAGHK